MGLEITKHTHSKTLSFTSKNSINETTILATFFLCFVNLYEMGQKISDVFFTNFCVGCTVYNLAGQSFDSFDSSVDI